ncbi:MAG: DUF433 domain-containing protein [Blastocatellia bacterium]
MNKDYVTRTDDAYRIADTRVSLGSVVYSWLQGDSPETIADNFPVLSLEQIYGAIAFYLAHQAEVDERLRKAELEYEKLKEQWRARDSALHRKLLAAKIAKSQAAA